ncbi:putative structural constituent of ribosome [Papiliotrema laurentii]|uniref:Protein phosphatase methylesterase 1 n=1 Tax=Papiliotrema laurentii TaxID=5418 RepID=A0AAD9CV96_PAPLA|nr:putative structural constituent of ribosome [Papiliotrema laurentii]
MSEHFRKSLLNRLPSLPPTRAPWADEPDGQSEQLDDNEGDDLGDLQPPSAIRRADQDLSPLSAGDYFDQALEIHPPGSDTKFRAYTTHATAVKDKPTVLVCHHGGGASGLSFATLAKQIKQKSSGELGTLTYDCRGHGKTTSEGGKSRDTDLSLDTLLSDFLGVITHMYPDPSTAPSLLLLGHSMGAAPILSAAPVLQQRGYNVPGVIVLDVVEGTAVEALPIMKSILAKRPDSFASVVDAIHWHVTSNSIRNAESARVSVPSFLVPVGIATADGPPRQVWRTDLLATEPYWAEWYAGLSSRFLSAKCARLLVLAGQERLDKELMVGQMQGKFQLEVMQEVGHYLHEDDPATLASTIVTFWRRNTRVLVLPPKIGASGSSGGIAVKKVGER